MPDGICTMEYRESRPPRDVVCIGIPMTGIGKIAALLNEVLFPGMTTTVLLETMAGKGSEVGGRFEQLRAIIDCVQLQEHVGVCLDTCHVWDAGYDIAGDLDGVLAEFDRVIGLERLHAVHLNNSLNPCGCHKDRHAKLLDGCIPPEALAHLTEAFYRVDKSRSRAQGGAGLGLSLCNEIVQLHGGTMQFESRVGNGTVVTVELKGGRV